MKRLRDLREDKDLTQNDLAKMLGCSQTTYSRYETGQTSVPNDILNKLADFYDVSLDYLFARTDVKKPYKRRSDM
ncbi:MAG: helix-turn-helix transcriptional regulator [Bacilli bacterium]|nr:helix-turn-helix transcriptional regulator [Bacilli bacterium]